VPIVNPLDKAKQKLKEPTSRSQGYNVRTVMRKVKVFIHGWISCYYEADIKRILQSWNELEEAENKGRVYPTDKAYQWR
jgi:hypothetical protein